MHHSRSKRFWRNSRKIYGFSLVEVLVTTVLTTLLVSSLLTIMVELTSANQTEHASSTTNEEMKQALDHIAAELREAIYVYTGEELSEGRKQGTKTLLPLKTYLPNFGTNTRHILAFWKVEPVPYGGLTGTGKDLPTSCTNTNTTLQNECEVLLTERRTYTLVVYVQSTDNPNNEWKGDSRIWRYQLRKYSNLSPTITKTTGYVDPTLDSSFQDWPYNFNATSLQAALPQTASSSYVPLVDFVASPTTLVGSIDCPVTKNPVTGNLDYKTSPYGTVPTGNSTFYQANNAKSFYACVRDASSDTATAFNQDVMIYLRGNSKGKPGVEKDNMIEILQNQSISRGVLRKTVGD